MHYLQHHEWPDDLSQWMQWYYHSNYIARNAKFAAKTRQWRKELKEQPKQVEARAEQATDTA